MSAKIQDENWKAALTRLFHALADIAEAGKKALDEEVARKARSPFGSESNLR